MAASVIDAPILIKCYDENFEVTGYVDEFRSFKWGYSWGDVGHWEIILSETSTTSVNILKASSYIECHNVPSRIINTETGEQIVNGVITKITTSIRPSGGTVKVEGYELKGIAKRRIILTKETYSQSAKDVIEKLLDTQLVHPANANRALYGTILNTSVSTETTEEPQQYENLADVLKNICEATDIGYQAAFGKVNGRDGIVWGVIDGVDRTQNQNTQEPMLLAFENETLDEANYEVLMDSTQNVAYVGGKGEGTSRKIETVGDDNTGLNRVEIFVDARNEVNTALAGKGEEALNEYSEQTVIKLKPSFSFLRKFGTNFNVGDVATFVNLNQNMRLTEANITFEGNNVNADFTFGYDKKSIRNTMNILLRSYKNMLNL